jgi:DNA repair exonuclease SbcCD nuclease subunit
MNILLVGDPHLTDNPLDAYRWDLFKQIADICKIDKITYVFILGDGWDRKDRHSAKLVNQSIGALQWLSEQGLETYVLAGNHDSPIYGGVHYWEFLNELDGVHYITKPEFLENIEVWLLPFSSNPAEDWKDLKLELGKALLMHQTVAGALVERDYKLEKGDKLPTLPNIPIYSGDVHRPQTLGNITYIGAPYPTRFGEDWECHVLVTDTENWKAKEIPLENIRRLTMNVMSVDEVFQLLQGTRIGDQLRIRFYITQETFPRWAEIEKDIRDLVKVKEVQLLSLEAIFQQTFERGSETAIAQAGIEQISPEQVVTLFADEEKLIPELKAMGLEIIKETL